MCRDGCTRRRWIALTRLLRVRFRRPRTCRLRPAFLLPFIRNLQLISLLLTGQGHFRPEGLLSLCHIAADIRLQLLARLLQRGGQRLNLARHLVEQVLIPPLRGLGIHRNKIDMVGGLIDRQGGLLCNALRLLPGLGDDPVCIHVRADHERANLRLHRLQLGLVRVIAGKAGAHLLRLLLRLLQARLEGMVVRRKARRLLFFLLELRLQHLNAALCILKLPGGLVELHVALQRRLLHHLDIAQDILLIKTAHYGVAELGSLSHGACLPFASLSFYHYTSRWG